MRYAADAAAAHASAIDSAIQRCHDFLMPYITARHAGARHAMPPLRRHTPCRRLPMPCRYVDYFTPRRFAFAMLPPLLFRALPLF